MSNRTARWLTTAFAVMSLSPVMAETPMATGTAEYRELPREYRLDGVVEAINQTTVSAQTSGEVREILFDIDDYVTKGTVIIHLKDTEQQARLTTAEADLAEAKAHLKQTRDDYARTQRMFEKKLVADAAMDKADTTLKKAQARVEAAQAGLAQAQEQFAYTKVRAPYSGLVIKRHVELGEIAQRGQALMTGISLDQLRVNVDVPQSLIPSIRELGVARIQKPGNGWVKSEKITIFPFADFGSNTFKVRLLLPEETPNLFPGMFVRTAFLTGSKKELVIPATAVAYRSEVTGVYVLDAEQRLRFRHVRVGHATDDGMIIVLAGLDAGERVALDPIEAGVHLKLQRREQ